MTLLPRQFARRLWHRTTVNSDCSGSATLTLNKGDTTTRHFNFQILHNSEEVFAIVTDTGRIETIDFKQL